MGLEVEGMQSVPKLGHERRQEQRTIGHGSLNVHVEQAGAMEEFNALLVDSSQSGLCIRHWRKGLPVGQPLRIRSSSSNEVQAEIKWNWSVGPVVMSGLKIVDREHDAGSASTVYKLGKPLILSLAATLLVLITWLVARW